MANETGVANGQELRRDRRFQVSQAALITQVGHGEIACEIRDFCFGGLFLKFTNPEAAITALAKRADAEVEIVFTPAATGNAQSFRIPAQLKRLSPLGVGVAFSRPPQDALRALQKLRMASHRQKLSASAGGETSAHLRETCTTLLSESLQQVWDHLNRNLDDRLSSAASRASGIAEHSGLLNAPLEFNRHATAIRERFIRQVMNAVSSPTSVQGPSGAPSDGGLSLVDEVEFEDWLATSTEAHKLEELFREQLSDIEPRIGQLYGMACDHTNNPFGPTVISHAYREALVDVPLLARARQVAYTTLRESLADLLASLYAELLAMLPVSHAELQPAADASNTEADYPDNPQPHTATSPGSASAPGQRSAGASENAASSPGTLGRLAGSMMDFFRGQAPAGAGHSQGGGNNGAGGMSAAAPGNPPISGAASGGTPSSAAPAGRQGFSAPGTSPVLQRLAASGAIPANLSGEMARSVDMFGALFDTMHAEKSVSEGMRPFFQQLETSLIKLAMSDPAFLNSPTHPAHKVLNTLDRISMIAGDDGKITDERLLRLMQRWTDRINAEGEKNPGVFEEARTQLERVVKPLLNERIARVFRLQEMCEGRQRAEVTKRRILDDLLQRLGDRAAPNAVIELLNGGWRNVLLISEMREGRDSEAAQAAWHVLDQLSAWLNPARETAPDATEAQALLQIVDAGLTHVCADKFAQDRLLDQLTTALFDQTPEVLSTTPVTARLNEAAPDANSESWTSYIERLRVGDWMQFSSLDTPLNLIWIGDQPPVYVFANYRGIKKLDLKRAELLRALDKGEADWTEDLELPLMDRSYSAMIQKMQRDLVWQASHDPMTGLSNRKAFFRSMRRLWLRDTDAQTGYVTAIIQLDLQHESGEAAHLDVRGTLLRDIAESLHTLLPAETEFARAGESALAYWTAADSREIARTQAESVRAALQSKPYEIEGARYVARPAIGLMWAADCLTPEIYYDNANAVSAAARLDANQPIAMYGKDASDDTMALAQWAHTLTDILANDRLSVACQAVAQLNDPAREPVFYEILLQPDVQADHPLATRELIHAAERLQRITEIDRWVTRQVLQWMRAHPEATALGGGFSINLSGQSVTNPLFLKFLLAELNRGDIAGNKLIFEINEAAAIEGHAQAQLFMRQLQRHGCRFMLDEFGTSSSSYTSLKGMNLSYLKIDPGLMRELSNSMIDEALVRSILETANFLHIQAIACQVETPETLDKLADLGVELVQGYLIGAVQPLAKLG
ncbi:MAG: DUF1631 family protein [Thiobacillus sp.]